MSAKMCWTDRQRDLPPKVMEERKNQRNSYDYQKRKLIKRLGTDDPPIPFLNRRATDNDERRELFRLLMIENGFLEKWKKKQHYDFLLQEVNNISIHQFIDVQPADEFHDNYLLSGLTHKFPASWSYDEDAIVMGLMPKELLFALTCNLRENNNKFFNMIANSKASRYIRHAPAKTGWYRMLEQIDLKGTHIKIDTAVRVQSEAMKNLFFKSHRIAEEDELDDYTGSIGVVGSKDPGHQHSHTDFDTELLDEAPEDIYILHTPLQEEGAMMSLYDPKETLHKYIYVPFGTFLALRADVYHGGFYGNPGNARFHMVIKRGPFPREDKLETVPDEIDALNRVRDDDFQRFFDFHVATATTIASVYKDELTRMTYGVRSYDYSNFRPKMN